MNEKSDSDRCAVNLFQYIYDARLVRTFEAERNE